MTDDSAQENDELDADNACDPSALTGIGAPARVRRLNSLADTRAEMCRLYREARRRAGRYPDALTAQRLASVLGSLRDAVIADELRTRIEAIEARLGGRNE